MKPVNPRMLPTSPPDNSWVLLARIVRPQGRKGEVLADIFTDFPQAFSERKRIFLRFPDLAQPSSQSQPPVETKVESHWLHKGRVVLKLASVDSIEEAEKLRGREVVVPREERMPLEGDAVYVSDLLGMIVVDVNSDAHGGIVGEVIDVEPEASGPALLVIHTPAREERLIPFVRAYLRQVDLDARRLEMELPPGLLAMQGPPTEQEEQTGLAQAADED